MTLPQFDFTFIIGQFEAVAWELIQDNDHIPRVTSRDGVALVCTRDYKPERVNLTIVDNKVVSYLFG